MFSVGDLLVLSQPINELRSLDSNTDFISNKTDINKYVWTNLLSFDFGGDVSPAKVKEFMFSSWTFFLDWLKEKNLTESARLVTGKWSDTLCDQPFDVYSHSFKGLFGYIFVLVQSAV